MVVHLGPEDHFVIAALSPAKAAGHPGFEKDRASFHIPARREIPRHCKEVVENRFRMLLQWRRLAAKKASPEGVMRIPHIDRCDVRQLMIVEREEAFAGREGLHRQRQGCNVEKDHVGW